MTANATTTVRSMTGQGHAQDQSESGTISVEVRTVNNRGFKCVMRLSEALTAYESQIEAVARKKIHRGSVYMNVNWHRPVAETLPKVNHEVLNAFAQQLAAAQSSVGEKTTIDLATLLTLPGVIDTQVKKSRDDAQVIALVTSVVDAAVGNLNAMRDSEGANMAVTLDADCEKVRQHVAAIAELAPRSIDVYRTRLESKIKNALADQKLQVDSIDLLKEVQVYADRSDISEEITRLESHLDMFAKVVSEPVIDGEQPEPTGRKLDFIIQEMFRETNTIGSKAADAEVSAHVVEIKCAIERMRELVQNLE